jgi:hypothetical protein
MGKVLLVKDVPETVIRQAKAGAALQGVSLKVFVVEALKRAAIQAGTEWQPGFVAEPRQPAAKPAGRKAAKKQKPRR